jgi:SAM-dependent methyltransferase
MMKCRICGASEIALLEEVAFYRDFSAPVYDCKQCRSRFAESRPELYESFHANKAHYYATRMENWTRSAKARFSQRDVKGLKTQIQNFHFASRYVIQELEQANASSVLEVGCAWGYNSSYYILKGHDFLGVDISATAIEQAKAAFGDHFCTPDDPRYAAGRTFDGIFHLGTIGCIEKPIEFTADLLSRLNPGGVLVFNAPTRRPCDQLDIPWIFGACPPDLVTLFHDDFWGERFSDKAEVSVESLDFDAQTSLRLRLSRWRGKRQPDRGKLLEPKVGAAGRLRSMAPKQLARAVASGLVAPFVRRVANNFGAIVAMRKK